MACVIFTTFLERAALINAHRVSGDSCAARAQLKELRCSCADKRSVRFVRGGGGGYPLYVLDQAFCQNYKNILL